ncbi:MAG: PAS domain S-box protein, partial [Chloroflexota bacterium]
IGRSVVDFLAPEEDFPSAWRQFREAGAEQGRIALRRPDGSIRFAEYSAIANFIPGQNLSVMRDVTHRIALEQEREEALAQLAERVKELTLLHYVGQLLSRRRLSVPDLLQSVVELIPSAWKYPSVTMARIRYGQLQATTAQFVESRWAQRAAFTVPGGHNGLVEVFYREERPEADEGPFLAEERTALDALVGMLQAELERRQATESLRKSEVRYRTLFETMTQGVLYQDPEGRVIDINPAARRILGLGSDDKAPKDITHNDLNLVREDGAPFSPGDRPGRMAIRTGKPVYGQVMGLFVPQEKDYRWVVVDSIPQFRSGEDEPYQVYSTLEDITERKRAEQHNAQLASLVESSQDAIIGVDFEGTITSWNRGARQMFGYTPAEAIGQHLSIISPPEHRQEQMRVVDRIRRGENVENYSTVRLAKDGSRLYVSFSISPIHDSTGRPVALAGIARDVTAQKRAEARLRFQAQLLDSVDESVVAFDMHDRIVYWGKGAERRYGYTRQEAMGRTLRDLNLIPPQLSVEARQEQIKTVEESGAWRGEVRQQRKDGSHFWARISVSLVRDRHGNPAGFIGIDRDVTSQRQYERELEAIAAVSDVVRAAQSTYDIAHGAFEQLDEYLDVAACSVILNEAGDKQFRVLYGNGPYALYEGRVCDVSEGVTGRVIRKGETFISDDPAADGVEVVPPLPEGWTAMCLPLVSSSRNLGALWLGRHTSFDEADVRLIKSVADILANAIQRARFFERLEEQAFQVQRIVDTVEDGLLLLDGERRVLLANPSAAEHLTILAPDGGGDQIPSSWIGRRLTRLGAHSVQGLLREKGGVEETVLVERKQERDALRPGSARREFSVVSHPVVEEGRKRGWVLSLREVTEERRVQEMVQQQERLAAVGQLAAGIAHDFNNVMSSIVLYAQILQRREDLDDKERRRLDVIYRQANHAIELIKQILDFSRRSVMERSAMDLVPFFKEMFRLFEHTLPETISHSLHYAASEYIVVADPTRLQQAITNLAINARDAMPDGGAFSVSLSRFDLSPDEIPPSPDMAPGSWLKIVVADDGVGMSEEMVQHAFEPFYTTKAPGKGTGLGLAQVYGIIRQHDGYIVLDSVAGEGATFAIYLPLLNSDPPSREEPVPSFAQAERARREATILVVEDEEWARVAVQDSLQALGYRVLSAADGRGALEIINSEGSGIDLVLSDMVMPEMGGLQLFDEIRARHPHVKMIIMSGYPLEDGGRSLLEQGIVDWISKPFSVNDLAQKVGEIIDV